MPGIPYNKLGSQPAEKGEPVGIWGDPEKTYRWLHRYMGEKPFKAPGIWDDLVNINGAIQPPENVPYEDGSIGIYPAYMNGSFFWLSEYIGHLLLKPVETYLAVQRTRKNNEKEVAINGTMRLNEIHKSIKKGIGERVKAKKESRKQYNIIKNLAIKGISDGQAGTLDKKLMKVLDDQGKMIYFTAQGHASRHTGDDFDSTLNYYLNEYFDEV